MSESPYKKGWSRVGARTGTLKNPTKCLWRWEPDRRSNFFFNPPAHLCSVTYMTEISLIVTLNNQFTLPYLTFSCVQVITLCFPCIRLICLCYPRVRVICLCFPCIQVITLCFPCIQVITLCFPCVREITLCFPYKRVICLCFPCLRIP